MELRYLRYFVAVAEELNFRKAAERLHVTAPTLSVQIKTLEKLLGAELLKRDTTAVRLTAAGEVLLRETRELLAQQRQMETAVKEAARGEGGSLRIGSPGFFSYSFMRQALATYHERYPRVDLSLVELTINEEHLKGLESGKIQLGFVYAPTLRLAKAKGMEHLVVVDSVIHAIMSAKHPLAALKEVPLARLAEYPLLTLRYSDYHINTLLEFLSREKLKPRSVKKVDSFHSYFALLGSGEGVSILADMLLLKMLGTSVTLRPLKNIGSDARARVQVCAIWNPREATQQTLNFVEVLREIGVRPR